MNNYLVLVAGWALGQAAYATKKAWDIQKANEKLTFKEALVIVYSKETASFAFGLIMLFCVLFFMPDILKKTITDASEGKPVTGWQVYVIDYLRISSVVFGFVCQYLGYWFFGRAEKEVRRRAEQDGVNLPNQQP